MVTFKIHNFLKPSDLKLPPYLRTILTQIDLNSDEYRPLSRELHRLFLTIDKVSDDIFGKLVRFKRF